MIDKIKAAIWYYRAEKQIFRLNRAQRCKLFFCVVFNLVNSFIWK